MENIETQVIQYPVQCETCSAHLTDLGTLKSLEETVEKNFPAWPIDKKADLVIAWFEKGWKEAMALDIKKSKEVNLKQAQTYKKENIKAINK